MAELEEPGPYSEARYLAAVSVLEYQGPSSLEDINWYAQAHNSLDPELEVLENFGVIKEQGDEYMLRSWFEDDAEAIGDFVQIDYAGEWRDIDLSDEEKDELADDGAEIVYWLT